MSLSDRVAVVLVHHKNFPGVIDTLQDLLANGVATDHVVLVDNSEDTDVQYALTTDPRVTCRVIFTANRGYGAAANTGIEYVARHLPAVEFVLISSHEVRVPEDGLRQLLEEMEARPSCGVLGPLLTLRRDDVVWSSGGRLTPISKRPFHKTDAIAHYRECDWVDGAFALYRVRALETLRFDERYFMYFEETDLHTRMRAAGWHIGVMPSVVAVQDTNGVPPYLLARNSFIFARTHASVAAAWSVALREAARMLLWSLRGGKPTSISEFLRGLRDGVAITRK